MNYFGSDFLSDTPETIPFDDQDEDSMTSIEPERLILINRVSSRHGTTQRVGTPYRSKFNDAYSVYRFYFAAFQGETADSINEYLTVEKPGYYFSAFSRLEEIISNLDKCHISAFLSSIWRRTKRASKMWVTFNFILEVTTRTDNGHGRTVTVSQYSSFSVSNKAETVSSDGEMLSHFNEHLAEAVARIERSGYTSILALCSADINMNRYKPRIGRGHKPLPKFIAAKKAVVNIHNDDNLCFIWCLLAHLFPTEKPHPERTSHYKEQMKTFKYNEKYFTSETGITPCSPGIRFIESQHNLRINIYGVENTSKIEPEDDEEDEELPEEEEEEEEQFTSLAAFLDELDASRAGLHYDQPSNLSNKSMSLVMRLVDQHRPELDSLAERSSTDWTDDEVCTALQKMLGIEEEEEEPPQEDPEEPSPEEEANSDYNIVPLRISKHKVEGCRDVNLFWYDGHYSLIKSWTRFCGHKSEHHYTCQRCLSRFYSAYAYTSHEEVCETFGFTQKVETPRSYPLPNGEMSNTMSFKAYSKTRRVPIVVYADTEAFNTKLYPEAKVRPDGRVGLQKLTRHDSASYKLFIVSDIELPASFKTAYLYRAGEGDEPAHIHMLRTLIDIKNTLMPILKAKQDEHKRLCQDEFEPHTDDFKAAETCYICSKPFDGTKIGWRKCRDHCHNTGRYLGPAHSSCNLKSRISKPCLPVFFHNMSYDLRFLVQAAQDLAETQSLNLKSIKGFGDSVEKWKSLSFDDIHFRDTCAFMGASLESILKALPDEKKSSLRLIAKERAAHPDNTLSEEELFQMVNRKGEFPYEWFDSPARFNEPIPGPEAFASTLRSAPGLSEKEYESMMEVCRAYGLKNFGEFHDLYLKRDVYGVADFFEQFREMGISGYGLDPAHFMGTPGFAWDAMLLKTGVKLQLVNQSMYEFFERGIRGGICHSALRHCQANNKYLPNHDETRPSSFCWYVDRNNLYGEAMIQKLPCSGFQWMSKEELKSAIEKIDDYVHGDEGCTLEVDITYPKTLHDLHNDYPMCPEHRVLSDTDISDYTRACLNDQKYAPFRKLMCTLNDKKKYIVHSSILSFYIKSGLKVTRVHSGIKYTQSKWMSVFIDFNTQKRAKSKTDFEKDYWKLCSNATFGKSMESVRDRSTMHISLTESDYIKTVSKGAYKCTISGVGNEHFAICSLNTSRVSLCKPVYVGQAILDLSKLPMYDYFYNYLRARYPQCRLNFTDTDSLCVYIQTDDMYNDLEKDRAETDTSKLNLFATLDTSNYPQNHTLYTSERTKQLGYFKDEACNNHFGIVSEAVALRAKVHSHITYFPDLQKIEEEKKCKGVSKVSVKKQLNFDDFKRALDGVTKSCQVNALRSYKCTNHLIVETKKALSPMDDKRYLLNATESLAYGHKDIHRIKKMSESTREEYVRRMF